MRKSKRSLEFVWLLCRCVTALTAMGMLLVGVLLWSLLLWLVGVCLVGVRYIGQRADRGIDRLIDHLEENENAFQRGAARLKVWAIGDREPSQAGD